MSCDISHIFRTYIKALETAGNAHAPLKEATGEPGSVSSTEGDTLTGEFSFANRATSLRFSLSQLSTYLVRIQQLTAANEFVNPARQQLHRQLTEQAGQLIGQCTSLLSQLRLLVLADAGREGCSKKGISSQCRQHRQAIYESVMDELTRLKSLRDLQTERQCHLLHLTGSLAEGVRSVKPFDSGRPDLEIRQRHQVNTASGISDHRSTPSGDPDITYSEGELAQLRAENLVMYDHLSSQSEEVRQLAQSISDISKLNQTLSTHLVDQLELTQQIGTDLTGATEHIQAGNELVRDALSKKASMQCWILFIVIVLTFSVNFLDWYYE